MADVRVEWRGDELAKRASSAALAGTQETLDLAAAHARAVHPGWSNRTGTAERTIHADRVARDRARATGRFGFEVPYGVFLEHRGHTIERAAQAIFPSLAQRIARRFRESR